MSAFKICGTSGILQAFYSSKTCLCTTSKVVVYWWRVADVGGSSFLYKVGKIVLNVGFSSGFIETIYLDFKKLFKWALTHNDIVLKLDSLYLNKLITIAFRD